MKALKNLFVAATLLALMAAPAAAGVHAAAGLSSGRITTRPMPDWYLSWTTRCRSSWLSCPARR